MVSKNSPYQSINMNANTMSDDDYESVIINDEEEDNSVEITQNISNEVVHEVFPSDIDQTNIGWSYEAIQCLIYYWRKFKNCSNSNNNNNNNNNKLIFWQLVSEHMVEQGFYFDAQACEIKWCDLKKIYLYKKMQLNKSDGIKPIVVWSHYFDMDKAIKGIPFDIIDDDDVDGDDNSLEDKNCTTTVSHSQSCRKDEDKCHWTTDATTELIRLYSQNQNKFLAVNPGGKHLVWEEISQQLSQLGYNYSANYCNDKWRNLKMTYKSNKQRSLKYGIQQVKWIYFKDMDNIYSSPYCKEEKFEEFDDVITVSLTESNEIKNEDNDEDFQVFNVNTVENNNGMENLDTWTESATKSLIELWGVYRQRFLMAPQGQKRLLWNEISKQLCQKGHNYTGLVCDRKWRLLKANYLKRKEKYKKLGVNSVKWQYYQDMDRLLGVPVENISWNMESTMCLINTFDHNKEKFMKAATGEKHLIWKQISEELNKQGYRFSPRACDNKWRTLKNRYNKNRMRYNRNKRIVWVYYEAIDKILRAFYKDKNPKNNETSCNNISNQAIEDVELDEHNYIKTSKGDSNPKKEAITELKTMFELRNVEFDQKLKEIEDNLHSRDKMFQDLQQQTLDALKRFNDLEVQKLKLLEQLVTKLPKT